MREYQVRFWDAKKIGDTSTGRWRVRWSVAGREHHRSFRTKALAEAELQRLKDAARAGRPFDPTTGQPIQDRAARLPMSWYDHARGFAARKWPTLAPKSRRSLAEALTVVSVALVGSRRRAPDPPLLRAALRNWAFNPRAGDPPPDIQTALAWMAKASPPVAVFTDLDYTRGVLDACALTQNGLPAAATTVRRTRAVLHACLACAVEAGGLDANPLDLVRWKPPALAQAVDRRVVANPTQVGGLLDSVAAQGRRGPRLRAFFACLYYAALRPAEAVALNEDDCLLPDTGWGRIDLSRSEPRAGRAWTDTGAPRQTQGLKHRARDEVRHVPIPPVLVAELRAHISAYGTGDDGRLFTTARGHPLQDSGYSAVWHAARQAALTPTQAAGPLARRPYDLRHAAVSLWLNSGVPVTEVARRAGHGVAVLLRVYANCIDGQADAQNGRIDAALSGNETA